jgi:hypothetical protein
MMMAAGAVALSLQEEMLELVPPAAYVEPLAPPLNLASAGAAFQRRGCQQSR